MKELKLFVIIAVLLLAALAGCMWGYPQYRVYSEGMAGAAKLKEAESSRQIAVEESKAKLESAKMLAQAEIERAKGVAEANKIIGDSLKGNDAYLRYLWLQGLEKAETSVIYVPTEANLPILEAGKRPDSKPKGQ